jgi:hypothetical protein
MTSPSTAGTSAPFSFTSRSSKTVMPKTMLAKRVTALLEAIAGARMPVFSADCCKMNPTMAEAMRA